MPDLKMTPEQSAEVSRALGEAILSNDVGMHKFAEDTLSTYTRMIAREGAVVREILPMLPVSNKDLVRLPNSDLPSCMIDREPFSPGALVMSTNEFPPAFHMKSDRYPLEFRRITSHIYYKDVLELRTWNADLRIIFSDIAVKQMLAEEDGLWHNMVATALGGSQGAVPLLAGVPLWVGMSGGVTRESFADASKIMPQTPSSLEPTLAVLNHITIKEIVKQSRNEVGGDLSEDMYKNGLTVDRLQGIKLKSTIKKGLVPTNSIFWYTDPKALGVARELEPMTMSIERKAYMVQFMHYECIGFAIGNTNGLARTDHY